MDVFIQLATNAPEMSPQTQTHIMWKSNTNMGVGVYVEVQCTI